MKLIVDRRYLLTREEILDAIYEYLRAKDVPVPDSSNLLMLMNADELASVVEFTYRDEIES